MKVIIKNRFDVFKNPGGDTVQMLRTKEKLESLGVSVSVSINAYEDLSEYDVVHVFNLMRPLEASLAIKNAVKHKKRIVFSSVYWDFTEYNQIGRGDLIINLLQSIFKEFTIEKIKDIVRNRRNEISILDYFNYMLSDYIKILNYVDVFLPNSEKEADIIKEKILPSANTYVVYNAVDKDSFFLKNKEKRSNNLILAARLDPRKNLINLVKAVKNYSLDIFGGSSPLHKAYEKKVKQDSGSNVFFKGAVLPADLPDIYNKYAIHIMPSWLETPGLSQLEAAACGCNIVSTNRGSTTEYFNDMAYYCDPGNIFSISDAVERCFHNLHKPEIMSEYILDNFTWEITAQQTLSAYEKVLNKKI